MSSDSSYANFLDQANQDTGTDKAKAQSGKGKGGVKLKSVDTEVPATLQKIDAVYVSEADEEFEGVALTWDGEGELDGGKFTLLSSRRDVVFRVMVYCARFGEKAGCRKDSALRL